MGRGSRWEYLWRIHPRYRGAARLERRRILDEFCEVAGYNRKYAIRLLNGPPPERSPRKRRPRRPSYGKKVVVVLLGVWEAARYPWSVRLKALLPLWLPWARKRFALTPRLEAQLLAISPRQILARISWRTPTAGRPASGPREASCSAAK